ncbi:MAG: hypothetical protein ACYC42_07125 [Lysobacter sp.]
MTTTLPMALLLLLVLAACNAERPVEPAAAPPVIDQPEVDVPPATAPPTSTPAATPSDSGPMPAQGAIGFSGFGPAAFGAADGQVRMAWGKDIKADTPSEPGGCYYLFPQPRPQSGYGIGFMIEGDKFARIDIDSVNIAAPGGGRIGMSADEIRTRYAGRIEEQNHKYVEGGKYLRIRDGAGGEGVLLFVTDAAGKVATWRIGVPPQVDYVEGCS